MSDQSSMGSQGYLGSTVQKPAPGTTEGSLILPWRWRKRNGSDFAAHFQTNQTGGSLTKYFTDLRLCAILLLCRYSGKALSNK
ncbi:MAG: hypothetical protein ACJ71B_02580 [Nitrososphaera sp.]